MYRNRSHFVLAGALLAMSAQAAKAITPVNGEVKAPLASSFPGPLWQVVAPAGGTASAANGRLVVNVPGGSNHDALHGVNESVRVVQPIGNVNFDVAIKMDSAVALTGDAVSQGLIVVIDDRNYITFAVSTDGSNLNLSANTVTGGQAAKIFENRNFGEYQPPLHLRLTRTGKAYTAYYSLDGAVWVPCGNFSDGRTPTSIGPFAGNYNPNPSRAVSFVMAINWFNVL